MDAVITAGGRIGGDFATTIGTTIKALAPIGDRRLIDLAIDAARAAGAARIALVGGEDVRAHCGDRVERFIPESTSGFLNVKNAIQAWGEARVLYLTSDLPFVTGAGVRDFTARAGEALVAMPLASEADYTARFPGAPPHLMTLGGRRFASGSVFLLTPRALEPLWPIVEGLFAGRKNALAMAGMLGPALLARYVFRRLRVEDIERRATRVMGGPAAAVWDADPGLCYDIDIEAEWQYAVEVAAHG